MAPAPRTPPSPEPRGHGRPQPPLPSPHRRSEEPRPPPGRGGEEGAEFSAARGGDKVWGAVAVFQQLRLEQLRPLGAAGGLPGQGPRWLPARPAAPRLGAGLSLITRDLTWPGGREGLRLRREAGGEAEARPCGRSKVRPRAFPPGTALRAALEAPCPSPPALFPPAANAGPPAGPPRSGPPSAALPRACGERRAERGRWGVRWGVRAELSSARVTTSADSRNGGEG